MEAIPTEEADIHAWALGYVQQQKNRMAASAATGVRPDRPSRSEVQRAVQARFAARGGIMNWIRIAFWVWWILSML